jgi:large subunit ribosomal protein L4
MKVDVVNVEGKKVKTVDLAPEIFEAPVLVDLMHQAFVRQRSNARLGTRSTKGRSEVSGGGRKPWRQKGTGRARQGSIRSPQWVGGGKVHTPHPKSYRLKMPKKMRRAALRSALSTKAAMAQIVVLDELTMDSPKTKMIAEMITRLVGDSSALILLSGSSVNVEKSVRNLPHAKTLNARYLNIRDLLGYDRLILPLDTIEVIQSYLGR